MTREKTFITWLKKNNKLREICRKNDICFLGLFGSRVKGTARSNSDVDFLVKFSKPKTLLDLIKIEREMAEVLKMKVDLVTESCLHPLIRERVMKEIQVIYDENG